ncbi:MAG: hypothetical protein B9S32_07190 [Verrucomicrobia bacterium Tous-C9LFEB]|nr:MAG: hypothetical protein B9S32_07190 [Verrucomicrobia bacterium Tous-C9LFEB]
MKLHGFAGSRAQTVRRLTTILFLTLSLTVAARADFSTGFETTSGSYTAGSPVSGVHDTGLPGTASWSTLFGSTSAITVTNNPANVKSGTQALHVVDADTSAYGVSYNLAGAVNYSSAFTLHFSLNVSSVGLAPTATFGTPIQFYLGDNSTSAGTKAYWTSGYVSSGGVLYLYVASSTNGSSVTGVNLGSYTTYSAYGQYVDFDITIDPTTHKYTNLTLTGAASGAVDKTSTLLGSSSGGEIPWLNNTLGTPSSTFVLAAGGGGASVFDIDNLSISNVPEPTTIALAAFGTMILLGRHRSRRRYGI